MMVRRKGELSDAEIDRRWPHQVSIPNRRTAAEYAAIVEFCEFMDMSPRTHTYVAGNEYHVVYCFADAAMAWIFAGRFGGTPIDPAQRPRWPGSAQRRRKR
jgi:hypothetical protein